MDTISESASPWRTNTELAVAPTSTLSKNTPEIDNGEENDRFEVFGKDGFTFFDFIDIINPLQHIPVIGTLYREMTDDTLDPGSRVLGGTLFLGPVGTVASLANVIIDDATGKDVGEHVMAFFEDDEGNVPQIFAGQDRPVAISPAAPTTTPIATGRARVADAETGAIDPVTAWAMSNSLSAPASPSMSAPMSTPISLGGVQVAEADTGAIDSVTAWAMAETSYRKTAAGKPANALPGATPTPDEVRPYREQAATPKPVLGWNRATPAIRPTAQVSTTTPVRGPAQGPARGFDALTALRADLKAGGSIKTANAIRDIRQGSSSLAAATYEHQQAANTLRKPNAATPPPGAIAAEGGWFTGTMLSAIGRYQEGADLSESRRQAGVDLAR